jgi:DNA replication and repair protein RecF
VVGRFELRGAEREISVQVEGGVRAAAVDGKQAASLEDYFGGVAVVAFTPDDLEIVKGGPDVRRSFLDRAVFNRFPAFLKESRAYLRALKGRNQLLRDRASAEYLDSYDELLARSGARVWVRRRALVGELAGRAEEVFAAIARVQQRAAFRYLPSQLGLDFEGASEDELGAALLARLKERLERDLDRGFTSVGPHTDDLDIKLGERQARSFASQGQQRALVLGWKIGEIENLSASLGFPPLLLLDDVSSELDPERNAFLMEYLGRSSSQVFLTTTDAQLVAPAAREDTAWLAVERGAVRPVERPALKAPTG